MSFRWTKLQDFCLRLGLLKVLVALLPMSRTSSARSKVLRRLDDLLFDAVHDDELLASAAVVVGGGDGEGIETVADALLITSGAESWGQPLKKKTVYKLLEWGHTTGLVVKGNRISERGLMLRSLFDEEAVRAFLGGEEGAWNPFQLTGPERAFFFYHLGEQDEVLWRITTALGEMGAGREVSASEGSVYELTLRAMQEMVADADGRVSIPELPRLRTVRELADSIDYELHPETATHHRAAYGPPAPRKPVSSMRAAAKKKSSKKNADHQSIPRFEQLVDMGFLGKPVAPGLKGRHLQRARNAWSFVVRETAERFFRVAGGAAVVADSNWRWNGFGAAVGASGMAGSVASRQVEIDEAVDLFLDSYGRIRRRAGHTPFESVALLALVHALARGRWFEIRDLHHVFLELKKTGALEEQVHFAAGNEVDRMFIQLEPGFAAAWRKTGLGEDLQWGVESR